MKRISEHMSSFHYTTWNLIVIFFWFLWASIIASMDQFSRDFHSMNTHLIRHWLFSSPGEFFLLKFWFVGLCILVGVLGLNLLFCSWNKIIKIIKARFNFPKTFMLLAHILFGIVAISHFAGFMLGFKQPNICLRENQAHLLQNGYKVKVTSINFVDDVSVLNKSKKKLTQDNYHYRLNFVDVTVSSNGGKCFKGRVFELTPLRVNELQVTLKKFIPPPSRAKAGKNNKPGVIISVSENPALDIFLIAYLLMIVVIAIYMLMTWRISNTSNKMVKGGK